MDIKMQPPTKILIVGEKCTGKTSLIQIFRDHDSGGSSNTRATDNEKSGDGQGDQMVFEEQKPKPKYKLGSGINQDFSLKILRYDG